MRRLVARFAPVLLASACLTCAQPDVPQSPSALPVARLVDVKVQYRQPADCQNTGTACENLVVFFGSWMKPGEEIYMTDSGGRLWTTVAHNVPVNWPPTDEPHLVRVFDPHLQISLTRGVTAARLTVGGQTITAFDSPGTSQESGLVYIDDNGVGHNPF